MAEGRACHPPALLLAGSPILRRNGSTGRIAGRMERKTASRADAPKAMSDAADSPTLVKLTRDCVAGVARELGKSVS